jgi:hypothetical protein
VSSLSATTVVEIVKFQATGLTEIQARTKAMGVTIAGVTTRAETLARLLNDPRYEKFVKRVGDAQRQYDLLTLKARNMAAAQSLADGSMARQIRSVKQLNDQYTQIQRKGELIAKYGERWGSIIHRYGGALNTAGNIAAGGAAAGAATAAGLARSGFQGTVEQNRFDLEMKMLAREFAGVMMPVLKAMTQAARFIRERMEGLSSAGQNVAMAATVAGGLASSAWAMRSLVTGGIAARLAGFGGTAAGGASAAGVGAAEAAGIGATAAGASRAKWAARAGAAAVPLTLAYAAATSSYRRPGERPSEYYDRRRAAGESKVESGLSVAGATISSLWERSRTDQEERAEAAAKASHRYPTVAGGGFEEGDEMYKRFNAAIANVGGDIKPPTEAERAIINALGEIRDRLPSDRRLLARPE